MLLFLPSFSRTFHHSFIVFHFPLSPFPSSHNSFRLIDQISSSSLHFPPFPTFSFLLPIINTFPILPLPHIPPFYTAHLPPFIIYSSAVFSVHLPFHSLLTSLLVPSVMSPTPLYSSLTLHHTSLHTLSLLPHAITPPSQPTAPPSQHTTQPSHPTPPPSHPRTPLLSGSVISSSYSPHHHRQARHILIMVQASTKVDSSAGKETSLRNIKMHAHTFIHGHMDR